MNKEEMKVYKREYMREYRKKHSLRIKEWREEYLAKNKEAIQEKRKRYKEANKERLRNAWRKSYKDNPEKWNAIRRKCVYGITTEQFDKMVHEQNNLCAICLKVMDNSMNRLVDHDHITKKVRGLLCRNCNSGLGLFTEDIKILEAAINYLKKWSSREDQSLCNEKIYLNKI